MTRLRVICGSNHLYSLAQCLFARDALETQGSTALFFSRTALER
jgi:hypothetical protein